LSKLRDDEWVSDQDDEPVINPTSILQEHYYYALKGSTPDIDRMIKTLKDQNADHTTLWALAVMRKMLEDPTRWEYEIRMLTDVIRQRCVIGALGDKVAHQERMREESKPVFSKIVYLSFAEPTSKEMDQSLVLHGFTWSPNDHRWWAWSSPDRDKFIKAIEAECSVSQAEKFL